MIRTRRLGDAVITNVIEYAGPTHSREYLFADLPPEQIEPHLDWLSPHHYHVGLRRFIVTMQMWVLQIDGRTILVDTGVGNHKRRSNERMNMLNTLAAVWLDAVGATPEAVTHVVTTHFHPDHVGGNTRLVDGRWRPAFPNARYLMPRVDFELHMKAWRDERRDMLIGAFEDSVLPIAEAGLVDLVDDGDVVAGCLQAEAMPGHTPGSLHFRLRSGGREAIFCGDIMHNPIQVALPWLNSRPDIQRDIAPATRLRFLERAAAREALVLPVHFGFPHCGYIRATGDGRYRFEPEAAGEA